MVSLRGSKFGSRVAMLCCNPSHATRPGPGAGMQIGRFNNFNEDKFTTTGQSGGGRFGRGHQWGPHYAPLHWVSLDTALSPFTFHFYRHAKRKTQKKRPPPSSQNQSQQQRRKSITSAFHPFWAYRQTVLSLPVCLTASYQYLLTQFQIIQSFLYSNIATYPCLPIYSFGLLFPVAIISFNRIDWRLGCVTLNFLEENHIVIIQILFHSNI